MKHLLDFQDIEKKDLENLIEEILEVDLYKLNQIKSLTLLQFNENSTRTRLSFAIAAEEAWNKTLNQLMLYQQKKGEGLMHEVRNVSIYGY